MAASTRLSTPSLSFSVSLSLSLPLVAVIGGQTMLAWCEGLPSVAACAGMCVCGTYLCECISCVSFESFINKRNANSTENHVGI